MNVVNAVKVVVGLSVTAGVAYCGYKAYTFGKKILQEQEVALKAELARLILHVDILSRRLKYTLSDTQRAAVEKARQEVLINNFDPERIQLLQEMVKTLTAMLDEIVKYEPTKTATETV